MKYESFSNLDVSMKSKSDQYYLFTKQEAEKWVVTFVMDKKTKTNVAHTTDN